MRRRSASRGASLVEALVAIAVLGVGTAAVTNLVTSISEGKRKLAFQTSALELFNRLNSEIQASTCLVYPGNNTPTALSADPAFLVPIDTWVPALGVNPSPIAAPGTVAFPVGAAHTRTLGDFFNVTPPLRVEYQLRPAPVPVPALPNNPFAYDVIVRVREIRRNAAEDNADVMSAHYIRTWPIRKACMARTTADSRGGYP